jgi:hypothetical protein
MGGVNANHVAHWTGAAWEPLADGLNDITYALFATPTELFAGGLFGQANNRRSPYLAIWTVPTADFNHDGDTGTDTDIEAFFACLAGTCCLTCGSADFNADGDAATDADIEAFFRVLAGGAC